MNSPASGKHWDKLIETIAGLLEAKEIRLAIPRKTKAVWDSHDWLVLLPEGHEYTNSFPISELTMQKRMEGRPEPSFPQ